MTAAPREALLSAVRLALQEDLALGDATCAALFPDPMPARAEITAHHGMTLAGVAVAQAVFQEVDPAVRLVAARKDGTAVAAGTPVLTLEGDARSLLMAERTALNFLQHLSGIATLTAAYCRALRGYRTKILDTRKTTPGLRVLEKWAVRLGGGTNHRQSLGDGILIKDNHLALLRAAGTDLAQACRKAREAAPHGLKVLVETKSLPEVRQALDGAADIIMLDNMSLAEIRQAIALIKGRALVEVSGGMHLGIVRDVAAAGADFVSIGALTHSAPAADLSMDVTALPRRRTRKRKG